MRIFRWIRESRACFGRSSVLAISGVKAGPYTSRYVFSRPAAASASSPVVIVSPATVAATFLSLSEYVPTPHQMKVSAMKESTILMAQEPAFRRSTSSMAFFFLLFVFGKRCRAEHTILMRRQAGFQRDSTGIHRIPPDGTGTAVARARVGCYYTPIPFQSGIRFPDVRRQQ